MTGMARAWLNIRPWLAVVTVAAVTGLTVTGLMAGAGQSAFSDGPKERTLESLAGPGFEVKRSASGPLVFATDSLIDPSETLFVVTESGSPYTKAERKEVHRFLQSGGKLVVAESFGHGGSLSRDFGIGFERVRLADPNSNNQLNATLEGHTWTLSMQSPTALRLDDRFTGSVLATSSGDSFLDIDGDGIINEAEPNGPFPVIARQEVGSQGGVLMAMADPALFQVGRSGGNEAWLEATLGHLLPDGGVVVVDESRVPGMQDAFTDSLRSLSGFINTAPWNYLLIGCGVALFAVALLPTYERIWRSHRFNPHRFIRHDDPALETDDPLGKESRTLGNARRWTTRGWSAIGIASALLIGGLILGNRQATYGGAFILAALSFALLPHRLKLNAKRSISKQETAEGMEVPVGIRCQGARHGIEIYDLLPEDIHVVDGGNWQDTGRKPGGNQADWEYRISPQVSGKKTIGPLLARAQDPLRLRLQQKQIDHSIRLRVLPRKQDIRELPHATKLPAIIMGNHLVNKAGDGTEFHALRDYQSGDSLRSVNWKASARSKELMVNQRVHESLADLVILVDSRRASGIGPAINTPLVQARRIAVSLAVEASRARDRVRVFAYGSKVEEPPAGESGALTVTRFLSDVEPKGDMMMVQAVHEIRSEIRSRSPVIIISGLQDDKTVLDAVAALRGRRIEPIIIACKAASEQDMESDPALDVETEPDNGPREENLRGLRALGVRLFETKDGRPLDDLFKLGATT